MRRAHRIVAPASDMSDALSDGGVRESRGRAEAPVSRAGLELTSPTLLLCLGQASENLLYSEEGPVVVSEFGFRHAYADCAISHFVPWLSVRAPG